MDDTLKCSKCRKLKTRSEFYRASRKTSGLQSSCKACGKAFQNSIQGKRISRRKDLKKKYGITIEDYNRMLEEQGGVCAICGTVSPRQSGVFSVDHDHETSRVRGLLCHRCNMGMAFMDDIKWAESANVYLVKNA